MKLKDIIKLSAVYLGRENVVSYLESNTSTTDGNLLSAIDTFTRCANLVIAELSTSYVPLLKKETLQAENGKIYFSSLTETALEIVKVTDENGKEVDFIYKPDRIETDLSALNIEYKYLPSNLGLNDIVGYTERQVPSRIIAYGIAAEFSLCERAFDESVLWHNRFTSSLSLLLSPKNVKIKERSFI